MQIGKTKVLEGNALNLLLPENSIDVIITSPPYSFAIDYLKNDKTQLEYLDADIEKLYSQMIGLQGYGIDEKLQMYFDAMEKAIAEMYRVLKESSSLVIVIGTNDIQTKGVRLETKVIDIAQKAGFVFELSLIKPIRGLQNSMKEEFVLFFKKQS
ncbi:MAG: hypothetical protein LBU55_06090 [Elusimicrobiota bacterium]|nr:hypothetical protein [Elusimicrobiota bacterium]